MCVGIKNGWTEYPSVGIKTEPADDVKAIALRLLDCLDFGYIVQPRLFFVRSHGAKANCYARIWSMPEIWRVALDIGVYYVIEVLSEHFDRLSEQEQAKVIIHELLHIPGKFSGGLRMHKHGGLRVDEKTVNEYYQEYVRRSARQ